MRTPEDIERMLGERLIPRGFSERGRQAAEGLLDELAAESPPEPKPRRVAWIAAAAALVAAAVLAWEPATAPPPETPTLVEVPDETVELLSESVGVVSAEADELLRSDAEGNLLRAWHMEVVSEERFRDAETGHEVRVVHPSDEIVLMPVSAF